MSIFVIETRFSLSFSFSVSLPSVSTSVSFSVTPSFSLSLARSLARSHIYHNIIFAAIQVLWQPGLSVGPLQGWQSRALLALSQAQLHVNRQAL